MKTVWKYTFDSARNPEKESVYNFMMPKGAKIIHMAADPNGFECIWVEFDDANRDNKVERILEVFGTGHVIPPLSQHVISWNSGPFVWHMYDHGEVTKPLGA